jgi:hypothetical protein
VAQHRLYFDYRYYVVVVYGYYVSDVAVWQSVFLHHLDAVLDAPAQDLRL